MSEDGNKPANIFDLPGLKKVSEAERFFARLDESGIKNYYLFRIRPKQKIIAASKGVKPLSDEGRAALEISTETAATRIQKNVGNYGCYAFPDGLCFLDLDMDQNNPGNLVVPIEKVEQLIEELDTFTVLTRSGGYQFYFTNTGFTENPHVFYSPENHQEGEPLIDAGELRCNRQYVVCPGSYVHPKGPKGFSDDANGVYRVAWDSPIRPLDISKFPKWLKLNDPSRVITKEYNGQPLAEVDVRTDGPKLDKADSLIINARGIPLSVIRANDPILNDLLKGSDRINKFKSASEADESVVFRLLRQDFSDQQVYDIVYSYRGRLKIERTDYLYNSIAHAKAKICNDVAEFVKRGVTDITPILLRELPPHLPSNKVSLMRAAPRSGKTRRSIVWALEAGSATYVSATHEVVENALHIMEKVIDEEKIPFNKTAVHVTGKTRACNETGLHGNCGLCYKFPRRTLEPGESGITFVKLQEEAKELLREKKILTPDRIPSHMCPYYTLHIAEKIADYCFTVPHFLFLNDPIKGISNRGLLIMDEDTTVRGLYPQCVEIAEEFHTRDQYAIKNILNNEIMWFVDKLEEKLTDPNIKRVSATNKAILEIIGQIKSINSLLVSSIDDHTPENLENIHELLKKFTVFKTYPDEIKAKVLTKIADLALDLHAADSDASKIFEPFLYPATPFLSWQGAANRPTSLFIISERTLFKIPKFQKLVLIGATESELFMDDLVKKLEIPKDEIKIFMVDQFKYAENYVFFEIFNPPSETPENKLELSLDPMGEIREPKKYFRRMIESFSENNRKHIQRISPLLLTATIESQNRIQERLGGGSISSTNHDISEVLKNWETGRINIFYQNSIISRGLDIPYYHLTFVHSCNFATPYWTAVKNFLEEEQLKPVPDGSDQIEEAKKYELRNQKIAEYKRIITRIQTDETTNGVLRTAPTPGRFENHIKLVFYMDHQAPLLNGAKYPGVQTVAYPTTTTLDTTISLIQRLVDPVTCASANPYKDYLKTQKFHSMSSSEAKEVISQYMSDYKQITESYNLPIEAVGIEVIRYLSSAKHRLSEPAIVRRCYQKTSHRYTQGTIRKVLSRMVVARMLTSSMSGHEKLLKTYDLHESIRTLMKDSGRIGWDRIRIILDEI